MDDARVVAAPDPAVAFRFGIPSLPTGHVQRPRLLAMLEHGVTQPLTLVSAAAGAGKTSLAADWAARRDPAHTAWITFEPGDGLASTFWSSVFAQLHAHGVSATEALTPAAGGSAAPRALLAEIAASLSTRAEPLVLVLDGWEFTMPAVTTGVDFLLRHSGHRLAVVIVTRSDPVLPLHRYRLHNLMTEVRTADLAFTPDEVRELLDASDLTLTEPSIDGLVARTHGWVAGIRLAMLSVALQPDPDAAMLQLAGDTGNIAEYLLAEVLDARSELDRELLLNTCVVDVLRPGLIEALAGPTAPRGLAQLARANAFVETVDDQPGWYRYHPLFRALLRAELSFVAPARSVALHRRAGRWHADHGLLGAAVSHAAAAHEWAEAAQYVVDDLAVGALAQGCEQDGLSSTLCSMPTSVEGPAAAIVRAAVAMSVGDTTAARDDLELAQSTPGGSAAGTAHSRSQRLANGLICSLLSLHDLDAAHALQRASAAAQELEGQSPQRLAAHPEVGAMLHAARATALLRVGQRRSARSAFLAAAEQAEAPGCEPTLAYCLSYLALLDALDGALRSGSHRARRGLELVARTGVDGHGIAEAGLAQCWIALQQADAASARDRIASLRDHGDPDAVLSAALLGLASARLARLDGDPAGAAKQSRALRAEFATSAPWVVDLAVEEEVVSALAAGESAPAPDLVDALSARGDTRATLAAARVRLRERVGGAADLVTPIATRADEPLVNQVTASLVAAEAALQRGAPGQARALVQRATLLAAPETLRWPLREAAPEVRELIARHRQPHRPTPLPRQGPRQDAAVVVDPAPMIDALTVKELEVLNHLSELLSTEEIAAAMFVSVNTVRTHIRSILRKLSVTRRNQAVRRARVLDILTNS